VKDMIGAARVIEHDTAMAARALARLARHPRISVLGPSAAQRLAILSFNIEGLHHDLVSALLDHLFGIQNRAGCACAGPYGHRLLGIDAARSERYRREIARGNLGVKPGWVRLTLPYYGSEEDVEFMLAAVELIADCGIHFVPCYRLGWRDGIWCHIEQPVPDVPPLVLTVEALGEAAQTFAAGDPEAPLSEQQLRFERAGYLREARALARTLEQRWKEHPPVWNSGSGRADLDELVWFKYVHTDGAAR
jgi:Aminotransferase class-V